MPYDLPLTIQRLKSSHRFDAFSIKLGRMTTLLSASQVAQWILLEVDPEVRRFCERPTELPCSHGTHKLLVDFWVEREDSEEFLALGDKDSQSGQPTYEIPNSVELHWVSRDALVKRRVFIQNWRSMLPYVTAYRRWMQERDLARVVSSCDVPTPLSELERTVSRSDPLAARSVIFTGLALGRLVAPTLDAERWGLNTIIERGTRAH